jgi:tetratricopeptide (TPR) repeat protein
MSISTRDNKPSAAEATGIPASQPEARSRNHWLSLGVCLFLALAVWAVFGQTLHYEFVNYDDRMNLYENPAVGRGLSLAGVVWAFSHVGDREWYPLTWISRMVDVQLYGMNAGGHHSTNVLLHTATVILLFLVLRRMTGRVWPAAFVAAVFAIHPLRVESVAWVTERKDVLSGFFFMLTLWAYGRYVAVRSLKSTAHSPQSAVRGQEAPSASTLHASILHPSSWRYYALALLFFTLGVLAKTMVVTLPFVLLLLDYWPLGRLRLKPQASSLKTLSSLLLEKLPFFAIAAAGCLATLLSQPGTQELTHSLTLPWRIGNALMAYADYLGRMVYPVGLAVGYAPPPAHLPAGRVSVSLLVLALISVGAWVGRRKRPYLLVGWLWYLGMLVPVIDMMQSGINARADRFTYLPQIGLYIMAAWGAADLCRGWRQGRTVLAGAAAAILAALLAGSYFQTKYWKDSTSLWARAAACTPTNQTAHNNLGILLAGQGKLDEALDHLERAVQLKPDYAKAYYNLGTVLAKQRKLPEAIPQFERAVQLNPGYVQAHMTLASALTAQGKFNEAVQHLQQALSLAQAQNNPALAEAIRNQLKMYQPAPLQPQTP